MSQPLYSKRYGIAIIGIAVLGYVLLHMLVLPEKFPPANREGEAPADSDPHTRQPRNEDNPAEGAATRNPPIRGYDAFAQYGVADGNAVEDLRIVSNALASFHLAVKNDDLPTGSNRHLMDGMLGRNKSGIQLIRGDHPMLNADGEIVDRWGTPLYFHAISRINVGVRSAGPDKEMWTDDDLTSGPAANPVTETAHHP